MSRPLHIAISARALSLPFGGVKEFLASTIGELLGAGGKHRFTIYYADPSIVGSYPEAREVCIQAPHKSIWDHWMLPRRLLRDRPDVVWFPHNVSSLGLALPTVVTVHDLLYFRVPGVRYREYPVPDSAYMRAAIPPSLRRARRIVADSEWTAGDIERVLGIGRERVAVVHLAPGAEFTQVGEETVAAVRARYGLVRPFFLYSGVLSPRKNVRALVEAFGRVRGDVAHDLVLAGGRGGLDTPIDDLVTGFGIADRVRRIGVVPRHDLVALYNAATAFVFPSKYEGFGIPPLEAMACGCPVISTRATSLAEVVGDAALAFEPEDVGQLARHLVSVAADERLRQRLAAAGLARAGQFSYARSAARLLALLEEAAA